MRKIALCALLACASASVLAADNRIDIVRHDAPELAHFGGLDIGVRTVQFTDPNRPDILNTTDGEATQFYDRTLTVEIWYPAQLAAGQSTGGQYSAITRNPNITATLHGKAIRNANVLTSKGDLPLIIVSHGYPGNRYLMSHLGENLASKGYVVASIDHRDSTYDNQQSFASTLYNRPLDQLFVLSQMAELADTDDSFLSGLVDANNTGIVGYSMGGYGLINNLGGGYNEEVIGHELAPPNELLYRHAATNPKYRENLDNRIKAGFAIGPWGLNRDMWKREDLKDIKIPTFYLAGSVDDISGYENGTRGIFENATNSDRYLLTYINAGHNAGAPMPVPIEIQHNEDGTGANHYTDPVWGNVRMNNIMDHFATAFFDHYLKGNPASKTYLDLIPNSNDGVVAVDDKGQPTPEHTHWKGFDQWSAKGLILEHRTPGE